MCLIVYFDGQYWVGMIEVREGGRLRVYRHLFGSEPKEAEIWAFIHEELPVLLTHSQQTGINVRVPKTVGKMNPKRRQRQISKELKQKGSSTKSQQAIQAALDESKGISRKRRSANKQADAQRAYEFRVAKAKRKKRGK